MHGTPRTAATFGLIMGGCTFALACADGPPDFDFKWQIVGDPGNRGTNDSEVVDPFAPAFGRGGVPYQYRITESKVTVSQYMEFCTAYAPYWGGAFNDIKFIGYWGQAITNPDGSRAFLPKPGSGNYAARVTWEMSARYTNWLNNSKGTSRESFESGAYDTSTFYRDVAGYHHQTTHSPGAQFWMPTLNEWLKAAYFDPYKDGVPGGGYWSHPNSSNHVLKMDLPSDGGETIGDLLWQTDPGRGLGGWNLGQYPNTRTPWGLLDVSATVEDFTEERLFTAGRIATGGSLAGDTVYSQWDMLGFNRSATLGVDGSWGAIRVVSMIPSTATATCLLPTVLAFTVRRRRK